MERLAREMTEAAEAVPGVVGAARFSEVSVAAGVAEEGGVAGLSGSTGVAEVAAAGGSTGSDVDATSEDIALPHPERAELELAAVLHALSDPMRLRIVAELAASGGERTCKSFDLPIVKSTCTHHFKVLREAGLIRQQVVGTKRVNTLRRDDLEARFPGLLDAVLRGAPAATA